MKYSKSVPYIVKYIQLPKWKNKILHIFDPIFRQNYWVFNKDWKEKDLKEYLDEYNCDVNLKDSSGKFWGIDDLGKSHTACNMGVIWFTELHTLVHECIHATHWLMGNAGLKYDDEFMAYYTEWLFTIISMEYDK
jgi:hypothetical protein